MPPYLEMSARLLWEAPAACGDAGKLCPEGFVLFDNWHKGLSRHQEELWTAYGRLNGMFSKSHKADKEVRCKAEGADYWLHSGNMEPDGSADHAAAVNAPVIDWFRGPVVPYRDLADITSDFAPTWVKIRMDSGEWGGFDLEAECRKAGFPPLKEVREDDLWQRLLKYMPPLRYQSFDEAWMAKETLLERMDKKMLMRQAHTCLRIEFVLASPTDESCEKMSKRGGVTVFCRCTVCGDGFEVMRELAQQRYGKETGFTMKGKMIAKPLCELTLDDLLKADPWCNARRENGGSLIELFEQHVVSRNHRVRWVKKVSHHDTHLGGLANGGSARHNAMSLVSAQPVTTLRCLLPRSGRQGATYPTKESVMLAIGNMQDVPGATTFLLRNERIQVMVSVDNGRSVAKQILKLTDVARIVPSVVYWTTKQIDMQYRACGSGGLIEFERLFDTDLEWWENVLGMQPIPGIETLPQAMMECLIHERGIACGANKEVKWFPKPKGYVDFARKMLIFKQVPGWNPPDTWVGGEPSVLAWAMLKQYPVAVTCDGSDNPLNPRGSGYYGVVKLELAAHCELRTQMGILTVIPCKEQLYNRYDYPMVEAWPADTLAVYPSTGDLSPIPEGVDNRNGVWSPVEDLLHDWYECPVEDMVFDSESSSSVKTLPDSEAGSQKRGQ